MKEQYYQSNSKDKWQLRLGRLIDKYEKLRKSDSDLKLIKKFTKKIKKLDVKLIKHYA